ncbi:unnamed protein product [Orchesella dallaii]|uniref:Uncharacterized protein n=1 Tax=Orchesella dallaii TaxID=48710 RepID=A0ABP1Q8I7_9HEXA
MFGLREVDISQIPEHITKAVSRIIPDGPTDGGLNSEDWDAFSEDGVWIVQCSKDVKISELLTGKKLKLNGTSTIPVDDEEDEVELTEYVPGGLPGSNEKDRQYEAISVPNENFNEGVLLLLPDESRFKVVSAPVQGHIIVRESIKDLENPMIEVEKPTLRELPAGIKERHPVYGADFTNILKKMEAAPIKSPKKKKKKSIDQERQYASQNGISSQNGLSTVHDHEQNDSGVKRKKGKNKHNSGIEVEEDNFVDETHVHSNRSVKKSFPLIVDFSTPYDEVDVSSSPKKKKSKKRKRDELDSSNDFERTDNYEEVNDVLEPPVKKKKKTKTRYFE